MWTQTNTILKSNQNYKLKDSVKRTAVGIWSCGGCRKTLAGGAWVVRFDFYIIWKIDIFSFKIKFVNN